MKDKAMFMPVTWSALLTCAGALTAAAVATADPILIGSSSQGPHPGSIFTIDGDDGTTTLVGATGLMDSLGRTFKIPAVAFDPSDSTLYGIAGSACQGARLIEIDRDTGAGTVIGALTGSGLDYSDDTGNGSNSESVECNAGSDALTFGADGKLYVGAWNGLINSPVGGNLLTVDKSNGQILASVPTADGSHIAGLATAPDGTIWVSHGNNPGGYGYLHTIDPSDGSFTSTLTLSPAVALSDIAFDKDTGVLYGAVPDSGELVTIDTDTGAVTEVGPEDFGAEKISGLALATTIEIPLSDGACSGPGGCNPTGGLATTLPPDLVIPEGATMTQTGKRYTDPRIAAGTCGKEPLVLFGDDPDKPNLIFPKWICSARPDGEFVVLEVEAESLQILSGIVQVEMYPGEYWQTFLSCDETVVGDVQQQDIVVWQPTDASEALEKSAVEVTNSCGSSRGSTRRLSYFAIGMKKYFADYDQYPNYVHFRFKQNTAQKIDLLQLAITRAWLRHSISFWEFIVLSANVRTADRLFNRRHYRYSALVLKIFKYRVQNYITFDPDPDGFNHQGELLWRADNIVFQTEAKIIPNE